MTLSGDIASLNDKPVRNSSQQKAATQSALKTPCVGICSTGLGDSVCRGCKRYCHEVIHWNEYSEQQQFRVLERLDLLLTQVMQTKLSIVSTQHLRAYIAANRIHLKHHRQNINPASPSEQNHYLLLFEVLTQRGHCIHNPADVGINLFPAYDTLDLAEIARVINDEFYLLSNAYYQAHFERVFTPL